MTTTVFSLFFSESRVENFINHTKAELGSATLHTFPDQECCIQIHTDVKNKKVIIFDSLNKPNKKILPLFFLAETVRSLGAQEVGFVSPYLAYMRQDKAFHKGEGISAQHFAKLISTYFDWLVTLDPHLHRCHNLNEIYTIPSQAVHAGSFIADWISNNITNPILIGPDIESEQWLKSITKIKNIPFLVLEKTRLGDKDVEISKPDLQHYQKHTPVLVDDIISSGRTMIETIKQINLLTKIAPICIGIHGVFSEDCYDQLKAAKLQEIITCNSIEHSSNKIDIDLLLMEKIKSI